MKRAKPNDSSSTAKKAKSTDSATKSKDNAAETQTASSKTSLKENSAVSGNANFLTQLQERRLATAEHSLDFNFKKKRARVLTKATDVREDCKGGILYWMSRDCRVQDNWAFLFAQRLAFKLQLPLLVGYCLVPKYLCATLRHYKFLLGGLEQVERDCRALKIPFHLFHGAAPEHLPAFVRQQDIGAVVCDFSPLREPRKWTEQLKQALPKDVGLSEVDAHNIVPAWITSDKQEYAARTIRNKITSKLGEFLTEFPPLVAHKYNKDLPKPVDWQKALANVECDMSVDEVNWAQPGYEAAVKQLESFCNKRLAQYNTKRNDPTANALSNLSPWFRFGHISVQRCVLEVGRLKKKHKDSVEAFCEEAVVRRELSDNFCYYNEHYDQLKGASDWAIKSLDAHRKDPRTPCYTLEEFEQAHTHDDLWNSAQIQLLQEGKIHGFMRMYWAKKILEWSESPEKALEIALLLNDKYSLDGLDPNGYVGCMWSIVGIHDQGWAERAIFGKIRYMNYKGCQRKFDVSAFVARYGGKIHKQKLKNPLKF